MAIIGFRHRKSTTISRADRAREAGKWQLAAGLYRLALERTPENPPIWIQYGHALKESGHPAEAETAYRTAIAYNPADPDAHLQLGHALKLQGKQTEAERAYIAALTLNRSLADTASELAALGWTADRLAEAIDRAAATAGKENPSTGAINGFQTPIRYPRRPRRESVITRADRAREAGQWQLATQFYRKALDRNPDNPAIWVQYGHALKESGKAAEAESAYRRGIEYDSANADTYLQLGHALKVQGRHSEAETCYLQALALDPVMLDPLRELQGLGWSELQIAALRQKVQPADLYHPTTLPNDIQPRSGCTEALSSDHHLTPLGTQSWSVLAAEHLRSPAGAFTCEPSAWLTPGDIEISFLQGAIRRKFAFAPVRSDQSQGLVVALPMARALALTVPFVALAPRLLEIKLGSIEIPPSFALHYSLHSRTEGPSIAEGVFEAAETSKHGQRLALRTDCFLSPGARHFLRLWCESTDRKSQCDARLLIHNFSSDHFWNRRRTEIGLLAEKALPDETLLRPAERYYIGVVSNTDNEQASVFTGEMRTRYPADVVEHRTLCGASSDFLEWISGLHLCIFLDLMETAEFGSDFRDLIAALNVHGTCTVFMVSREAGRSRPTLPPDTRSVADVCQYLINAARIVQPVSASVPLTQRRGTSHYNLVWDAQGARSGTLPAAAIGFPSIRSLRARFWPLERLPRVGIISVLYNKTNVLSSFLRAIYRQNYPGKISVVLIDDASPGEAYTTARAIVNEKEQQRPRHVSIRLLANEVNLGNCLSRNRGLNETEADIYVVIDADCLINRDFVTAHVRAHLAFSADAVVGPLNIETGDRPGWEMLEELEEDCSGVLSAMDLQDDIQPNGFLNCVTRNLSVNRDMLRRLGGFDPEFSYSTNPESGFGWEDVEFGYRLYAAAAYIHFTPDAFSLHQSHPRTVSERQQVIGSAKHFNKLFDKHPEMLHLVRRWAANSAERILTWANRAEVEHTELERLRARFAESRTAIAPFLSTWRTGKRRLRVVSYRWHVPHQHEIYKLPHDFTLLTGIGSGFTNAWEYKQRPLRSNVRLLPATEFDAREYDLAILHFDENMLCSDLSNGIVGQDWGRSFQWFLEHVRLPTVGVCHGTPPFVGQFAAEPGSIADFEIIDDERLRLTEALRDIEVVCNSHQAAREWRFHRHRVIWHGMDPQDFPPGTHELGVVSHGSDRYRPHYRGLHELQCVQQVLGNGIPIATHAHESVKLLAPSNRAYPDLSYRAWVDHLRRFKVYLNTTLRSPMPRSRTEAMMCGVIPISLRNHDVEQFTTNGVNGFYGESPPELAEAIRFLLRNEGARVEIARAARDTAARIFNHDRFLTDWTMLLRDLGV